MLSLVFFYGITVSLEERTSIWTSGSVESDFIHYLVNVNSAVHSSSSLSINGLCANIFRHLEINYLG
jgi:hypothetical protein